MISQDIINESYIRKIITRDADRIYTTQAATIRENFKNERADQLANFLITQPFTSSGKNSFHFRVFTYLRFLDIWHSGRHRNNITPNRKIALYNRVIWGVLYRETLPDLRYGMTKDIQDTIKKELQSAFNS